jgi:aryl-alcohol dehydrogenase-like predicted oxidoreductase
LQQIVEETLPALRRIQQSGKVRFVGISGYPMKIFDVISSQAELDCILSYNQYTLQNTTLADDLIPKLKAKNIGIMNGGPFSARLLTNATLPVWFRDPKNVQAAAKEAALYCQKQGVDIAQLALQFSCANKDITTTIAGSANPSNIRKWVQWLESPVDTALMSEVISILQPVKNVGHLEGLPENN